MKIAKKVIISPYTTVKGRKSNYTFYVKTAGYEGRDLYSEIDVKGTGTVIFPEIDLLRDCDQITYSKKSNVLSLKINFGQNNQFTLDIKNYVEQSSNKPYFVLIDKNGSNIVPKIERSDLSNIEIKSFELHTKHSLDNFDDVESHYKRILNNNKDYKVFSVIRGETESQDNNMVTYMVFGSSGDDVINFDQGTMFARGGKGNDMYVITDGINNKEVKIDNHSDDKKADTLFMPEVEKDFSIQQCDLHLNYNNTNIEVKNYFQDLNYRHLVIMNKKGETFIPNIQSISCSPSSSRNGKLVPFLQATQTQNMFLLPKDFEDDHVVIDSRLEDIEKYKDKDDLLLVRENENPFMIRIEGFYTDRDRWENISYSLWNSNDLLPSSGLLENVDNVIEYKDKLKNDYERIVKEYVEDFSDSTSIIQHNQKLEKNVSIPVEQDEERIGVMVLKNITPDQIEISSSGTDLVFRDKRSNHTINVKNWDNSESYRISTLEFDLGLDPTKIMRLSRFSLSEVGKIQGLIDKASENYQSRAKYTPKVENDFKCLVSVAGFVNKNPTYQCLGFSSLQDQVRFTEDSCSLEQISEFRDKLDNTQILALSRTLQNNLLLNGYDQDVMDQCFELMMIGEINQESRHYAIVKGVVRNELKSSILNNLSWISTFANTIGICKSNRNLCGEAMKGAVDEIYEERDIENILEFIHNGSSITQSVQGYVAVFDAMRKRNDLNKSAVFKLSYYIKEIMERNNLGPEDRFDLKELISKLPESVKNVVFASEVCIKNVRYDEYLHIPPLKGHELFVFHNVTHKVFSHVKDPWKIELDDDNYRLKHVRLGKYLNSFNVRKLRVNLFNMEDMVGDSVGVWKFEADGGNVYMMDVHSGQYLCATASGHGTYIRRVRPCSKDSQDQDIGEDRWKVEDCGSTRNRRSVQKSNRYDQAVDYKLILTEEAAQQMANRISAMVENVKSHVLNQTKSKLDLGSYLNNIVKNNADPYLNSMRRSICSELNAGERKNITLGGNNIRVITSGYETLDIENFPIREVVINDDVNGKKSLRRTLDLRQLVQQVDRDLGIKPLSTVIKKDERDLLVVLHMSATGLERDVITFRLKDGEKWYKKLQIIFDNAPMEIDDSLGLKPSLFISDEKITVVRPQDIEENNKLIISKRAGQYTYLHDKYDLIVTNAFNASIEANELCIIYFRGFYKEPKMKTLSIRFIDKGILLSNEIDKIYNSDSIDKLNNVSSIVNSQESSIPLEVPNSGDINASGELGRISLHLASKAGKRDNVKLLLDRGANIEAQDESGYTPIFLATQSGKWSVVKLLLDRGANIDAKDKEGKTLLHFAIRENNLDMIQFLLNRGADVNTTGIYGCTPLHYASWGGYLDVVEYLVKKGANINAKDKNGSIPLDLARDMGYNNVVQYLQQTQLSLDAELLTAVKDGDPDSVQNINKIRDLIVRGANINTKDKKGDTLLYFFAGEGDLDRTKFLLENGASTEVKNEEYDQTPLHAAVHNSRLDVVRLLLSFNANVNATDSVHWTPLHYAADVNNLDILKILADAHANLSATGDYGKTPLSIARDKRYDGIVEYLEEKLNHERGGRKRRHHHGDHNRHHNRLSRQPLAIDSSNQPEIAASSGTRPSSWINGLFGWVKSSVGGLLSSKSEGTTSSVSQVDGQFAKASVSNSSLTSTTLPYDGKDKRQENGGFFRDNVDYVNANLKRMCERQAPVKFKPKGRNTILEMGDHYLSQVDFNGTITLFDLLIRRFTGQKYISTVDQSISPLEAQGYALNITKGFEKVVEQAGLKSGVSMHRLNIDYMGMQKEIVRKVIRGQFNEISGVLSSYVEKACPSREAGCPGKLSSKKFDKFMVEFNSGLLNQSIKQILHNGDGTLEVGGVKQMSLEPQNYLSNASVQGHSKVSTCLSDIGVTKLVNNLSR